MNTISKRNRYTLLETNNNTLTLKCICGNIVIKSKKFIESYDQKNKCSHSCTVWAVDWWLLNNEQRQFNYWTINDAYKHTQINITCVCGKQQKARLLNIINGVTKSCGCMKKQLATNTYFDKTGYESPAQNPEVIKKRKQTYFDKTGYESPAQNPEVIKKMKQTYFDKTGYETIAQNPEVIKKRKQTYFDKTGYENPAQNPEVIKKRKQTYFDKTGYENPFSDPEITKIIQAKKLNNINLIKLNMLTVSQIIKNNNNLLCRSNIYIKIKNGAKNISELQHNKLTGIELAIQSIFTNNDIKYASQKKLGSFQPDFRIDSHRLIIEADGEYWHTEENTSNKKGSTGKSYHQDRLKNAEDNGYKLIAFYGTEIDNQFPIVESIIKNKLGMSTKIGARKTVIKEVPTKEAAQFFQDNHLMGKGSGRAFGLYYQGELATCIRVVKKRDGLDISRFAHVLNTNVVGGFSKLLKHVEKTIKPAFIQTFIDRRYGQGNYLTALGFAKETEHLSFCWHYKKKRHHRMKFPGNSGYDIGAKKIWDAGQARWVKYLLVES